MLNPLLSHWMEVLLHPTPAQVLNLLRISHASSLAELLVLEQANLAGEGSDVALAALVGGPDHRDRTAAGEAAALVKTPLFADCPRSALEHAISSFQCLLNVHARRHQELPQVSGSRSIAGHGLVLSGGPDTLSVEGVGEVQAEVQQMPDWARDALKRGPVADESCSTAQKTVEIQYSGWASVERVWSDVGWTWTVELDFAEVE
ncbi:hypothetical protein [Deinococcus marmoris]|uniref:Uncharacterized protein n=1 Tax=Deinococcus marmoris TaxID=249408 RepID=A0A1U7NVH0_9DEIO|nr:hypothetical protein [Deinococcus marmoris]OLV16915.1 hypothetical protein BOO71_0010417 [Deinococcus marmoris]